MQKSAPELGRIGIAKNGKSTLTALIKRDAAVVRSSGLCYGNVTLLYYQVQRKYVWKFPNGQEVSIEDYNGPNKTSFHPVKVKGRAKIKFYTFAKKSSKIAAMLRT